MTYKFKVGDTGIATGILVKEGTTYRVLAVDAKGRVPIVILCEAEGIEDGYIVRCYPDGSNCDSHVFMPPHHKNTIATGDGLDENV